MKSTRFIPIFLVIALIVSVFGFTASAQSAPTIISHSVEVTGPYNAVIHVSINPNGNTTNISFRYGVGSLSRISIYGNVSGTTPINTQNWGLIRLLEASTYSYQITAGSTVVTGNFTTPGSNSSSANTNNNNNSNNNQTINSNYSSNSGAPLAPSVTTNGPASVSANSAVINGSINPNNVYTNFWFDFGTSPSLGQKTSVQPAGVGNAWQLVTGNLSGLISGATYYYRVAAQNSQGTNWGEIKTFVAVNPNVNSTSAGNGQVLGSSSGSVTKSAPSNTRPVPISNPAKDRPSFVSLEYSLSNNGALVLVVDNITPKPGEEFSYNIVYKNESDAFLNEANLKVILPIQVDYVSSDKIPNNISANIVEFNLGNISPRTQGTVIVVSKVKETVAPGTNMIFTSVLRYEDLKGIQLANTAYMTVKVGEAGNPLPASIGSFIGTSGVLWLIAIALMLMMGLLVFRLVWMRKNAKPQAEEDIFSFGKVPATFEPITPPMGRPDIFQPVK